MTNLLRTYDVPVTIPSVVRAHYEQRPDHAQALGRDKLECESFMNYQLRLVKDLVANAQGIGCRPALETARLNRRLRSKDFEDVANILERMFDQNLVAETELMRALQEAYQVREAMFGNAGHGDGSRGYGDDQSQAQVQSLRA